MCYCHCELCCCYRAPRRTSLAYNARHYLPGALLATVLPSAIFYLLGLIKL